MPKRPQRSCTRVAAVRQAATSAMRSASFISGVRLLLRMIRSTSAFRRSSAKSFTGGMRMPSSQMDVAVAAMLPGTVPPQSSTCPNMEA